LELRSKDGTSKGFITVRLSIDDLTQAGAIAVSNAREDIERGRISKPAAAAAGSGAFGVGAIPEPGDLEMALGSVVSKLDIFINIVDKTSQVSMQKRYS